MIAGRTYYDILGLPKYGKNEDGLEVSFNGIAEAYNRTVRGTGDGSLPFWLVERANEAYRVLSDPKKREEYDKQIADIENELSSEVVSVPVEEEKKEEIVNEIVEEVKEEIIDNPETEIEKRIEEKVESKVRDESIDAYEELLALTREEINKEQLIEDIKVENEEFQDVIYEIKEEEIEPKVSNERIDAYENLLALVSEGAKLEQSKEVVETFKDTAAEEKKEELETFTIKRASALGNNYQEKEEEPILDSKTESEEQKEDNNQEIIPLTIKKEKEKRKNEKQTDEPLSDKKKKLIYGASVIFGGPLGIIVAYAIVNKKNKSNKLKLQKNKNIGNKIKSVKTPQSELIKEYQKKLDAKVDALLSESNDKYSLEISKARYLSQKELLDKMLEIELNKEIKNGHLTMHKLKCLSLKNRMESIDDRIAILDDKINGKIESKKHFGDKLLFNANKKLYSNQDELNKAKVNEDLDKMDKNFKISKLSIKQSKFLKRRDIVAKLVRFNSNVVGKFGKLYTNVDALIEPIIEKARQR